MRPSPELAVAAAPYNGLKKRFELIVGAVLPTPLMSRPPVSIRLAARICKVPPLMLPVVLTANASAVPEMLVAPVRLTTFDELEPVKLLSSEAGVALMKPRAGS